MKVKTVLQIYRNSSWNILRIYRTLFLKTFVKTADDRFAGKSWYFFGSIELISWESFLSERLRRVILTQVFLVAASPLFCSLNLTLRKALEQKQRQFITIGCSMVAYFLCSYESFTKSAPLNIHKSSNFKKYFYAPEPLHRVIQYYMGSIEWYWERWMLALTTKM